MAKEEKKKRHWLSRLSFGTVSLVLGVLLVLAYLSVVVDPAKAWFFTLFGLLFPLLLAAYAGPFRMGAHPAFHYAGAAAGGAAAVGLFFRPILPVRRPPRTEEPPEGGFLQCGALCARSVRKRSAGPGRFRAPLALPQDADLICLQEFYLPPDVHGQLAPKHFPGYKAEYYVLTGKNGHFGNLTLSRRPVAEREDRL